MKADTILVHKCTLELDEDEARWLNNYMQNPACEPERETKEDRAMREKFFNATKVVAQS